MNIDDKHVQCQSCRFLRKMPYGEAYPTHHENWVCDAQGVTMQYEFTVGWILCSRHQPGVRQG